jgi:hypothetical protein
MRTSQLGHVGDPRLRSNSMIRIRESQFPSSKMLASSVKWKSWDWAIKIWNLKWAGIFVLDISITQASAFCGINIDWSIQKDKMTSAGGFIQKGKATSACSSIQKGKVTSWWLYPKG